MELLFLGTGAADWKPEVREKYPDNSYRRFSSMLIDGKILIDPGPHIFDFIEKNNAENIFDGLKYVLITHSHPDHLNRDTLRVLYEKHGVHFYCSSDVLERLRFGVDNSFFNKDDVKENGHAVTVNKPFDIDGYTVLPVRSNHATSIPDEKTLNFCITDNSDGKRLFYGLDGAWMLKETYKVIKDMKFDAMILECTVGDDSANFRIFEHNCIQMVLMMRDMFLQNGLATSDTYFAISHLARTLHAPHDEVKRRFAEYGIDVAYDGMSTKV